MPPTPTDAGRRFRPSLAGTVIAATGVVLLCSLGTWQVAQFHRKQALFASYASTKAQAVPLPRASVALERYTRVELRGRYLGARQFLLDSMVREGESGYRVLTPLERVGAETVLVDRGWIPRRASGQLPDLGVPEEDVVVTGRTDDLPGRGVDLPDTPGKDWPRIVNYPHIDALERALQRPLYPRIVLLDANVAGGFVRDWRPPGLPPARHLGYAITWFGCALTLVVLYVQRSMRPVPRA